MYRDDQVERLLEKLALKEDRFVLRFLGLEIHRTKLVTRSRRRRWTRRVSLLGLLAIIIVAIVKAWFIS